jgi:hypothetical protein
MKSKSENPAALGLDQIAPSSIVKFPGGKLPLFGVSPGLSWAGAASFLGTSRYSAFARKLGQILATKVGEPSKPDYSVSWPLDVDERDPPLQHSGGTLVFKFDGHFTACGHLGQAGTIAAALGAADSGTEAVAK